MTTRTHEIGKDTVLEGSFWTAPVRVIASKEVGNFKVKETLNQVGMEDTSVDEI